MAKCGDGIGYVALHSSGCRAACSLRVGEALVIEQSFLLAPAPLSLRVEQKTVRRDT